MRTLFCLLLAGLLFSGAASAQNMQIRIYNVPVEHQEAMEAVLGEAVALALPPGRAQNQRSRGVSSPGRGQIVVTATPEIHADIERFLNDFQPAEAVNLLTEYWLVSGEGIGQFVLTEELEPVREVLASISEASGGISFYPIEHVEILAQSGGEHHSHAGIPAGNITQELVYLGEKIIGEFEILYNSRVFATEVAMPPGQFLVLGRTGLRARNGDTPGDQLFLIVRSQVAD